MTTEIEWKKGPSAPIVDQNGQPVATLRVGLGWDPASAQQDTKGGRFGKLRRKAKRVIKGVPKTDLDSHVVFSTGNFAPVRIANGNNRYPWQVSLENFGPVRSSADSVGGEGFGLDEFTDIDLGQLPGTIQYFTVLASTFDDGNFSTARNVTSSLWTVAQYAQQPNEDDTIFPVGDEFYPRIDKKELNISLAGFGWRDQSGQWNFTQIELQGSIPITDDVDTANTEVMAFAGEHLPTLVQSLQQG